ncbi:MAG: uroporphyrinogen-III C-methyltransferase [Psychromonas sp.]|nr:uroporphyrinogen-III C-methyltransferase [Psychromonas sp.]
MGDKTLDGSSESSLKKNPKKNSFIKKVIPRKSSVIIFILLLLVFALGYASFYFYIENKQVMAKQATDMSLLSKQLDNVLFTQSKGKQVSRKINQSVDDQLNLLHAGLTKVQNDNKISTTEVQSLQRSLAATYIRKPNDWILSEVEYLVKLAGRKIWLEHDIKTAIALLAAADQRIVELNDHSLVGVRSALFEDINMLGSLPNYHPETVILELSSLENLVDVLKTDKVVMPSPQYNEKTAISRKVSDWKQNLKKSWDAFIGGFIVINRHDEKIKALLLPEQIWYLKANLRAQLDKAEFAVYHEQQGIYDLAMSDTQRILANYFVNSEPTTMHFQKSINRLSKLKVKLNYPEQLKSSVVLKRVMALRVKTILRSPSNSQQK